MNYLAPSTPSYFVSPSSPEVAAQRREERVVPEAVRDSYACRNFVICITFHVCCDFDLDVFMKKVAAIIWHVATSSSSTPFFGVISTRESPDVHRYIASESRGGFDLGAGLGLGGGEVDRMFKVMRFLHSADQASWTYRAWCYQLGSKLFLQREENKSIRHKLECALWNCEPNNMLCLEMQTLSRAGIANCWCINCERVKYVLL